MAHAPSTAYVGDEKDLSADEAQVESVVGGKNAKGPILAGRKAGLVSALQTRDNVRIGFVGSGAMFSDKYWGKKVKTVEGTRWVPRPSSRTGWLNNPLSVFWRAETQVLLKTLPNGSSKRQV